MTRRVLLLLAATLAFADTTQELVDVLGAMSAALSEGNAAGFLRHVDPSAPDYAALARNVAALVNQNDLSASINIVKQEADGAAQVLELDWLLDIRGKYENHISQQREETVKCRLERRKNRWRVVSLEPVKFFQPPG